MFREWLRRALRLGPQKKPVLGTNPGHLWDNHRRRWVPLDRALSCRFNAYSETGPVYVSAGLQP